MELHLKPVLSNNIHQISIADNDVPVYLGRSKTYGICVQNCSKRQLKIDFDTESQCFTAESVGAKPGSVNEQKMGRNQRYILKAGDAICLLGNKLKFTVSTKELARNMDLSNSNAVKRKASDEYDGPSKKTVKNETSSANTEINTELYNHDKRDGADKILINRSRPLSTTLDFIFIQNYKRLNHLANGQYSVLTSSSSLITGKTGQTKSIGWVDGKNVFVYNHPDMVHSTKIASFDMDGTLINTISGRVFAKDINDWKLMLPEIPKKLKQISSEGYKVVIFTNQKGVATGKVGINDIKGKIEKVIKRINCPIQAFVSTGGGMHRKPLPGMWDLLQNDHNGGIVIDKMGSFYVGDAAGREVVGKKKKDFSCGDRLFAINVGLKFYPPEEYFTGTKDPSVVKMPDFDPIKHVDNPPTSLYEPPSTKVPLNPGKPEMIIMIGYPGSGKSSFVTNNLATGQLKFTIVNRDTLKSQPKCLSVAENALRSKTNVVIDNTNPDPASRKPYIDLARKYSTPVRCFEMGVSHNMAIHLNRYRLLTGPDREHADVNEMILNMFKSKYQEPTVAEGFLEVVKVNVIPKFSNSDDKAMFRLYNVSK